MTKSSPQLPKAEKLLSLSLYSAANLMVRMHKPFLEPLGLTFPQFLVMMELLESAPRFVGDLGESVRMDTGTITPLVKRLEQAGFVSRRRDQSDERRVVVDLTPVGRAMRTQIFEIPDKLKAISDITPEQARQLQHLLDVVEKASSYIRKD